MLCPFFAAAQDTTKVLTVRNIIIIGTKKTKNKVVEREMSLRRGDTLQLANLMVRLHRDEQLLMNLSLFNSVQTNVANWRNDSIDIKVVVDEALYIYPIPFIELADRNFETWWNQFKRDPARLNYMIRGVHYNLTGSADRLTILLQVGYSQKFAVSYRTPYLDKKGTLRGYVSGFYSRNRETQADTRENKQYFLQTDNEYALQRMRATAELSYKPNFNTEHFLTAIFFNNKASDTLVRMNKDFFNGQKQQKYVEIDYRWRHDRRDVRPYATRGYAAMAQATFEGLGDAGAPNRFWVEALYKQYFSASPRTSFELVAKAHKTLWTARIPQYNNRLIGYDDDDYLRGYDKYVQDGQDFMYFKSAVRYKFLERVNDLGKWSPRSFRMMPIRLYATLSSDIGYVRDTQYGMGNYQTNRWLWGGGPGIDIRVYFENILQFEYLFNQFGEKGLFLRYKVAF